MKYLEKSHILITTNEPSKQPINLFQQFFIHGDQARYDEIKYCLKMNIINPFINQIYLLNERIYTDDELGVSSDKIIQVNIGHRLKYEDVFKLVGCNNYKGYIVIANGDIFFDETVASVLKTDMEDKQIMMCQLRYEFEGDYKSIKIFGPRHDSQDVWIYHSNHNTQLAMCKAFNFQLGQAGCDNHITYLFKLLGFSLVNNPQLVHCLHFHKTQIRNYLAKDMIKPPYIYIVPEGTYTFTKDVSFEDNDLLKLFIREKLYTKGNFIIPRVAGVENNTAFDIRVNNGKPSRYDIMKNNAGVMISNTKSAKLYSDKYFKAFENCEMYSGWSIYSEDNVYTGIKDSQNYIQNELCIDKKKLWAEAVLDIFNHIHYEPWTLALKGKRVLIISSFIESIKSKINIREKIYGIDLFPECDFVFSKPPQLSGDSLSMEWNIELDKYCKELDSYKYDVALVSCGGLGNLVCNYIYESGKSAIYVGGVLSMYFGIYNKRMLEEKSSILRMYMNEYWSRPMPSERPKGWNKVEGGAYW